MHSISWLQENPLSMNKMSLFSKLSASLGPYTRPKVELRTPMEKPLDAKQLTISQAQGLVGQIMKRAMVPPEYRTDLAPYITDSLLKGRALPANEQNTDAILMNSLAGHTCVRTWVRKAFEDLKTRMASMKPDEIAQGRGDAAMKGTLEGMGLMLGQGFNYFQEPPGTNKFFERDANGKIIGIANMDKSKNQRFKECDEALRKGETLLGGRRRKTRRQRRKKRTSRRKLYRDMH
jgi:hypothetical protein